MNDSLGSGNGFASARDNNLFQLHLRCSVQIFTWLQLGSPGAKLPHLQNFVVFLNNLYVHVVNSKILLATCVFLGQQKNNKKALQELFGYTQYHIRIMLVANLLGNNFIKTSIITSSLKVMQCETYSLRDVMMLSSYLVFKYTLSQRKKLKCLEQETLFVVVNAVLYEYGHKKWAKPNLEVFLRKSSNFKLRTKIKNF